MLKIENATVLIDEMVILKNVSFTSPTSNLLFVIGKNGSGKTSLLKSLAGLAPYKLNFTTLDPKSPAEPIRTISLLESETTIPYNITVEELVTLANQFSEQNGNSQTQKLIDLFELKSIWNKNLLKLSSGERQRALIAHALNTNAQVFLLDEPLNHLDWDEKIKTLARLSTWTKDQGRTVIATIHDLDLIGRNPSPCLLVGAQTVYEFKDPKELFRSPQFKAQFTFTDGIPQT